MSKVTHIPTELWRSIVTMACTDGGFTGRSLALTSKFVHGQSSSSRFYSLAFQSLERLEGFLTFLHLKPEDCKPLVKHLYLSFAKEPVTTPDDYWRVNFELTVEEKAAHDRKVKQEKSTWDKRCVAAMTALFDLVSPSLRTFCLITHRTVALPPLPTVTLPRLQELSTVDNSGLFWSIERRPPQLTIPTLRRLHYIASPSQVTSSVVDGLVEYARSTLTHIRLSSLDRNDHLRQSVARLLGVDEELETKSSGLTHVVLHGFSPAPGGWCGHNDMQWETTCDELEMLVERCQRENVIFAVFMSRPWRRNPRWEDRLYDDWVDRIEGYDGCWVADSAAEEALEVYEDDPPSKEDEDDDDDL